MSASDDIASSIGENVSDMKGIGIAGKIVALLVIIWLVSIYFFDDT